MPGQYKDLGKAANDLFNKNYEHGKYSVEVKSKGDCGFEFTTKGHQDNITKALSSSFEHKMKLCKLGTLKTNVKLNDKLAFDLENGSAVKDAKFNLLFNMGVSGCPVPKVDALKVNYSCPNVNADLESNFGNSIKLAAVADIPKIPFLLGFNGAFDLSKTALVSKEIALNFSQGNVNCTWKSKLNNDLDVSIHNKISPSLALATAIKHNADNGTSIAIAGAAAGACGSSNQFRICNKGRMGLSHITPTNLYGAKFTVSSEFDAFNLASGSHKLGWGLKFDL